MSKKTATIILTVIFMVIFILVGVGSCGGIKYLINNASGRSLSTATVYADDDIGTGLINTTTDYISVSLNKYSFLIDGYRGNGFPAYRENAEYMCLGDLRFVALYNNDSLFAFYVTTLQLSGYYEAGQYINEDLFYINTDLTATNLVNVAFMNLWRGGTVQPGCLEFASQDSIDLRTCGRFLSVEVEISGEFNLSLVFENVTYNYVVSPYGYLQYGDYEVNNILDGFSYKEIFSVGSSNVVNTNEYFQKGYDAAYEEYYESRYDLGFNQGFNEGQQKGYSDGISDSGSYSFFSLISSVIDVPVKAFIGLTNFEFLGFNMTTFYKAMFGFAIIVIVLRVVLP